MRDSAAAFSNAAHSGRSVKLGNSGAVGKAPGIDGLLATGAPYRAKRSCNDCNAYNPKLCESGLDQYGCFQTLTRRRAEPISAELNRYQRRRWLGAPGARPAM